VTRCNDVVTSAGGEAAPGREKEGDDGNWANTNLTKPKNKENSNGQFIQLLQMNGEDLKQR
jgi:hypothetical protein